MDIENGVVRALEFSLPVAASQSALVNDEGTVVLTDVAPQSEVGKTDVTASEAVRRIAASGVTAICAMHSEIDEIETILPAIRSEWDGPLGAYPNRMGFRNGRSWIFTEEVTPEVYARQACQWVELGANIIGGCCGTAPSHESAPVQTCAVSLPRGISFSGS